MKTTRDEMYFEPRCVNENGSVRWYGEILVHPALDRHTCNTVYIRDGGLNCYVYLMEEDGRASEGDKEILTLFRLICRVPKKRTGYTYGRQIR